MATNRIWLVAFGACLSSMQTPRLALGFRATTPLVAPPRDAHRLHKRRPTPLPLPRATALPLDDAGPGAVPPGRLAFQVGGKTLNPCGLVFGLAMAAWVVCLYPLVLSFAALSILFDGKRRRLMDSVVTLWAKCSMLSCGYRPVVVGRELLPARGEAVLFVPNHGSYLDILTLSGFLPRPFKYISKIEILRIPLIGWAMGFAGHVALRRADRRSQLESYKKAVETLKRGNSLVAFPEGTRSLDGRLQRFKRGPFKMAIDAGVDIVPLAICDLQRWHPASALMPLGRPRDVQIKVLPKLEVKKREDAPDDGSSATATTPEELLASAWTAINAALPAHQRGAAENAPASST